MTTQRAQIVTKRDAELVGHLGVRPEGPGGGGLRHGEWLRLPNEAAVSPDAGCLRFLLPGEERHRRRVRARLHYRLGGVFAADDRVLALALIEHRARLAA